MFELFPGDAIRKTTFSVARDIGKGFVLIKRGEFEWSRAERFIRSFGDFFAVFYGSRLNMHS